MKPNKTTPGLGRDDFLELILAVVTGFVLFRLFDVWKPGAVRWAERRFKGGLGVMADDVVAGIYGAVCLVVIHQFVLAPLFSSAGLIPSSVGLGAEVVALLGIVA